MRIQIGILLLIFTKISGFAQLTVSGRITGKSNRQGVGYASIDMIGQQWVGTFADSSGYFELVIPSGLQQGLQRFKISSVGYIDTVITINIFSLPKSINISIQEYFKELEEIIFTANTSSRHGSIGILPTNQKFSISDEQKGFSSREKSGLGIYFPKNEGIMKLDSLTLHIPSSSLLPKALIIEVFAPLREPKSKVVNESFPIGRALNKKTILYVPTQLEWNTISLKNYGITVPKYAKGILLVVYAQYTKTPTGPVHPFYISWFRGKGKQQFTGAWLHGTNNSLVLLNTEWDREFRNIYPAIGLYYRILN